MGDASISFSSVVTTLGVLLDFCQDICLSMVTFSLLSGPVSVIRGL